MSKKLVKYGRDLALIIEEPILKSLHIDAGTNLEIAVKDGSLIITPSKEGKSRNKSIKETSERIMDKYHKTFEKLSKN